MTRGLYSEVQSRRIQLWSNRNPSI